MRESSSCLYYIHQRHIERETAVYVIEITSCNAASPSLLILKCLHSIRIRLEWILLASLEGECFSVQVQNVQMLEKGHFLLQVIPFP